MFTKDCRAALAVFGQIKMRLDPEHRLFHMMSNTLYNTVADDGRDAKDDGNTEKDLFALL